MISAIPALKCPLGHTEITFSQHTCNETFFPENTNTPANQLVVVFIDKYSIKGKNVLIIAINV